MDKILKPATIIPPELYVPRDADRQLRRVIDEMGRPGYILVSRQMGKTNLLLNAKRELESATCIFVYVDLSNKFDTARECFQNIIDTALTTNYHIFSDIESKIKSNRNSGQVASAHKEHEQELLLLLRTIQGKVVIVLDEIDALVNTEYSDQFFAQIRSIYFTRVNHIEFNRLTYVLSGVVEPSNIIKDKNRSPFNIGEKIFLDDFTFEEYRTFITKLHPEIAENCAEQVFSWTNGHPRMTWDVCSALEDLLIAKGSVKEEDVSFVIKRLYLDNYDKAPIDHIRDLTQKNIEIRRAVKEIWIGKGTLGESVKRKLYLSGIIKSDTSIEKIELKNKIIEQALSVSWIESIDKSNIDLLSIGNEQKSIGNYSDAIKYYKDYIKEYGIDNDEWFNAINYDIGFCYAKLYDFEKALEYYSKLRLDKSSHPAKYFNNLLDIGLCFFNLDQFDRAIDIFKEIITESKPSIIRIKAVLNYAGSLLRNNFMENKNEALENFKTLLEEVGSINFSDLDEPNEIKLLCYYNIGYIAECDDDFETAKHYYIHALSTNIIRLQPAIYCRLLKLEGTSSARMALARDVVDCIVSNKLKLDDVSSNNPLAFSSYILFYLLLELYEFSQDNYLRLAEYTISKIFTEYGSISELLLSLGSFARSSRRYGVGIQIFEEAISNANITDVGTNERQLLSIYRTLCIMKAYIKQDYEHYYNVYLNLLRSKTPAFVDDDYLLITLHSFTLRNAKKYRQALEDLEFALEAYDAQPEELRQNYIGLFFLKAQLNDYLKNKETSHLAAKEALRLAEVFDPKNTRAITMQEADFIKEEAQKLCIKNSNFKPAVSIKVGRNELCICGSGLKYKKCCGK